jgi:hypothetical protein
VRAGTDFPQGDPASDPPGETDADKIAHLFKLVNNVSMALNQHAVLINKQQTSQKKYLEEQEACSYFDKIAESISLYEEEFIQRLEIPDASKYSEETDNPLANKTHKICNKVLQLGHACYYLYRRQQAARKELEELRDSVGQSLENKASLKQLTSTKEQIEESLASKIKELLSSQKNALTVLEKKQKEGDEALRLRIEGLDRSLVGRLSELETLFASRAATKFVEDSLKELEDRLKRMMETNSSAVDAELARVRREQENVVKKEIEGLRNQFGNLEDMVRTLRSELEIRVTMQGLKDSQKKMEEGIISQLTQKIRDATKKFDPVIEGFEDFKRIKANFLEHEDRFLEFQSKTQAKLVTSC